MMNQSETAWYIQIAKFQHLEWFLWKGESNCFIINFIQVHHETKKNGPHAKIECIKLGFKKG